MCTAINFKAKDHYFGRNLDLDYSNKEEVCVLARNYSLEFKKINKLETHYALIGMATITDNTPLFYDACNEYGVAMAGLNFPNNACFYEYVNGKDNITPYEFIPWILGKCKNLIEVRNLLRNINIINIPFSDKIPLSPLHWIISYKEESIVIETMKNGMKVYDNPVGVLTNNPPFEYHLFNLNNYRNLKIINGDNTFSNKIELNNYCQGLGSLGLPGDVSSMSRFIRMTFNKLNSVSLNDENSSVSHFFHLLGSVEMVKGICLTPSNKYDITIYSSCMNTDKGLYYYKTYNNYQINCINMHKLNLNSREFYRFPLILNTGLHFQN